MADSKQIQQIVERAVAQVLDRQLPKLQAELVERVMAELPAQLELPRQAAAKRVPAALVHAIASIHAGTTQKEILRSLLDAVRSYAARVALVRRESGSGNRMARPRLRQR